MTDIEKVCKTLNVNSNKINIEQIVKVWNTKYCLNSDDELVQCKYCGNYHFWGSCKIWECENCNKAFCNDCVNINIDTNILCKECLQHSSEPKTIRIFINEEYVYTTQKFNSVEKDIQNLLNKKTVVVTSIPNYTINIKPTDIITGEIIK